MGRAAVVGADERPDERVVATSRWRRPGWPLAVVFVPFPLWWALGMSEFICLIMAVPMAAELIRRRRVDLPRGFGFWLLFLLWVVAGFMVIQVSTVGAVPDNSPTRYITWAYRLSWYLAITITLLYIVNTRRDLSTRRVARIISALFLTVVAGGLLGVFAPHFEFSSLLELVLPNGITKIQFVNKMIHPSAAQIQDVLGYESPRPSAPYSFTNTWGLNFACTLPFFLLAWCGRDAGWRRYAAPFVLVAAAVPMVYSINRGMWAALLVMALFVALRSAMTGRPAMLAGLVAGGAAVVLLVVVTSLGSVVTTRLTTEGSEEGRTNLGTLAVTSVSRTSPVIGLGSTRNVQGNFNTIAGGARAECPRCSPPALGTQGQLWLVVFSQGVVGLALYLAFFGLMFWRHLRLRTAAVTAALTTMVASLVTMPVYNSLGTGLMVTMVAVGVLVREGVDAGLPGALTPAWTFSGALRRWWPVVAGFAVLGASLGALVDQARGSQASAVTTVVMPQRPAFAFVPSSDGPMTVDTLAQLLTSDRVLSAVERATGRRPEEGDGTLSVRATANSRTLHVSVTAPTAAAATEGSRAAASTLLLVRQAQLDAERNRQIVVLQARSASLSAAIQRLGAAIDYVQPGRTRMLPIWATSSLRTRRTMTQTEQRMINDQLAKVTAATGSAGAITQPTRAFYRSDPKFVDIGSGLTLGLALGGALAVRRGRRGRRIGTSRSSWEGAGTPVLARIRVDDLRTGGDGLLGAIDVAVGVHDFGSCLPADPKSRTQTEVALALEQLQALARGAPDRCAVVAGERTRGGAVAAATRQAAARGMTAIGVIVVVESAKRRWPNKPDRMLEEQRPAPAQERISGVTNGC
jgi:hypothetical protein